jgi:hypothetical protein
MLFVYKRSVLFAPRVGDLMAGKIGQMITGAASA